MNGSECDGTDIFMRSKIECSIQRSEAKLNRTFHLSPNEKRMYHRMNERRSLFVLYNIKN